MTLAQAKATCRAIGFRLTYNSADREYRIIPISAIATEADAYYTDDRDDAVATARNWNPQWQGWRSTRNAPEG